MSLDRQQHRQLRGVVYTFVFLSFAVSTFFFVRTLYRNHKADLKARHACLHAGMTEADIRKEFGTPYYESECTHPHVSERELGRPLPPDGVQIKSWCLDRERMFSVYLAGNGQVLKVGTTCPAEQRTWIERRIGDLLE
jgi:hypothetical protein